jgi:mRNA interferase MazF
MRRGELYLVTHPTARDPKKQRVYVVVSRQVLIESRYSSVICAPVYSNYHGLATQVPIGVGDGVKHESSIHCDDLVSLPKSALTNYVGSLTRSKVEALGQALKVALEIPD